MPAIVLVGLQFGDEGKGKITDMLRLRRIRRQQSANARVMRATAAGRPDVTLDTRAHALDPFGCLLPIKAQELAAEVTVFVAVTKDAAVDSDDRLSRSQTRSR